MQESLDEKSEVKSAPAAAALQPIAEEGELSAPVSEEKEDMDNKPASTTDTVTTTTAPSRYAVIAGRLDACAGVASQFNTSAEGCHCLPHGGVAKSWCIC